MKDMIAMTTIIWRRRTDINRVTGGAPSPQPLPAGERKGPGAKRREGEGVLASAIAMKVHFDACCSPRCHFSIHRVEGASWPVGVTPSSHFGSTNASARK